MKKKFRLIASAIFLSSLFISCNTVGKESVKLIKMNFLDDCGRNDYVNILKKHGYKFEYNFDDDGPDKVIKDTRFSVVYNDSIKRIIMTTKARKRISQEEAKKIYYALNKNFSASEIPGSTSSENSGIRISSWNCDGNRIIIVDSPFDFNLYVIEGDVL